MPPIRSLLPIIALASCFIEAGGRTPAPTRVTGMPDRPLPPGAIARLGSSRLRHDTEVCAIAFSPDGRKIAGAPRYGDKVRVWDAGTGTLLLEFAATGIFSRESGAAEDFTIAFTPDGKMLAAGAGADVRFWDIRSGREARRFRGKGKGITALTFSSDGKTFYCGGEDHQLHQWDIATGKHLRSWDYFGNNPPKKYANGFPDETASLKAISPDGKAAVWKITFWEEQGNSVHGKDHRAAIWDVSTQKGRVLKDKAGKDFEAKDIVFSKDGKFLITHDKNSPTAVWDAASVKELETLGNGASTEAVAFSADSRRVVAVTRSTLRIWDLASGKELWRDELAVGDAPGWEKFVTISPDGKTVAVAHWKNVRLWDVESGKERPSLEGHRWPVRNLAFSPKAGTLISADEASICEWDLAGRPKHRHPRFSYQAGSVSLAESYETNARIFQPEKRSPQLRELVSGKLVGEFEGVEKSRFDGCFSGDGRSAALFSGEKERGFIFLDIPSRKVRSRYETKTPTSERPVLSVDGKWLAVPFPDQTIQIVDTIGGKLVRRLGKPVKIDSRISLKCPTFSPDGRMFAIGGDVQTDFSLRAIQNAGPTPARPGIRVWEVSTGRELRPFAGCLPDDPDDDFAFLRASDRIASLRFSPDGKSLAVASSNGWKYSDGVNRCPVRVVEVATGQVRREFEGHTDDIISLAFSPDGKTLATGSEDTSILLWDMKRPLSSRAVGKPADVRPAWADLAEADATSAYDAILAFESSPGRGVAFLAERLRPAARVSPVEVAKAIAELDADSFGARRSASERLTLMHEQARSSLTKALAGEVSTEARRVMRKLLRELDAGHFPADQLRELRSVEILEHVGTPKASRVLDKLAAGAPEAILTAEARAALARTKPRRDATHGKAGVTSP